MAILQPLSIILFCKDVPKLEPGCFTNRSKESLSISSIACLLSIAEEEASSLGSMLVMLSYSLSSLDAKRPCIKSVMPPSGLTSLPLMLSSMSVGIPHVLAVSISISFSGWGSVSVIILLTAA